MKSVLASIAVIGGLIAIHALPPLAVTLLPFWLLALMTIGLVVGLSLAAFWAFLQVFQGGEN